MKAASVACSGVGGALQDGAGDALEDLGEARRRQREAEAQRREQRLAERADVDHPARGVEAAERRRRPAGEAEVADGVVLDDPGVGARRRRRAARGGARGSSTTPSGCWCDGVTKARRKSGAAARPAATSRPSSSTGTGTRRAPAATSALRAPMWPGFSNQTGSPGSSEQRGDAGEGVLGALEDEDLLGGAGDAAVHPQVAGDRLAQRRQAAGARDSASAAARGPRSACADEPRPERHREGVVGRACR